MNEQRVKHHLGRLFLLASGFLVVGMSYLFHSTNPGREQIVQKYSGITELACAELHIIGTEQAITIFLLASLCLALSYLPYVRTVDQRPTFLHGFIILIYSGILIIAHFSAFYTWGCADMAPLVARLSFSALAVVCIALPLVTLHASRSIGFVCLMLSLLTILGLSVLLLFDPSYLSGYGYLSLCLLSLILSVGGVSSIVGGLPARISKYLGRESMK